MASCIYPVGVPSAIVLSHRHVANDLGQLEPWFERHEFAVQRVYREDRPEIHNADLLVVLGSPNSVATGFCEAPAQEEIAAVVEWISRDRPYLGICFGSQVLARALGGSVRRMPEKHRSYGSMTLTSDAPQSLAGSWALWHEDAITAPADSIVLATVPHADTVFTHGSAWGVQPHIEFTPEAVARLGVLTKIAPEVLAPLVQAMKEDEQDLATRAGLLLDTFWANVNSLTSP